MVLFRKHLNSCDVRVVTYGFVKITREWGTTGVKVLTGYSPFLKGPWKALMLQKVKVEVI